MYRLCDRVMEMLENRLLSNLTKKQAKLKKKMAEYQQCSDEIAGHGRMLIRIFIINLLQRLSQIGVTFMILWRWEKGSELPWKDLWFRPLPRWDPTASRFRAEWAVRTT